MSKEYVVLIDAADNHDDGKRGLDTVLSTSPHIETRGRVWVDADWIDRVGHLVVLRQTRQPVRDLCNKYYWEEVK